MANRTFYPPLSYGSGRVYLEFELLGNSTSAPTLAGVDGADAVASITRSGVGIFVITLKDAFNKVLFKSADIDDTLNDGAYATMSNVTGEGTATPISVTLRTRAAAGAAADPAVGRRVGIAMVLRNGNWGTK